jgi:ABC-2 type transport system permease protein
MRKVFTIAVREYKAAVKTKSFLISLILLPVMMGGSAVVSILNEKRVDTVDKKFVVIDHSGLFKETLQENVRQRNETEIYNEKGEKIKPAYILDFIKVDSADLLKQKMDLSQRVITKELTGFFEIGPSILHPEHDPANAYVRFYSESTFLDDIRNWFTNPINNRLRQLRLEEMNIPADSTRELFYWTQIEGMGLIKVDENTGEIKDAEKSNILQSLLVPYILVMLMFMLAIMNAAPLLTAVMEEKMEKIAEVLLATVTPSQFMAGKILGSTLVSLTTATIYVVGGIFIVSQLGSGDKIPYHLLPWFFVYLIFFLVMADSVMAAIGSACNDNKDAQNASFPANLPMILPLFVIWPVLQNPMSGMATWLSLFPPFTPMLMIVRLASPVSIPVWQPFAGLAGVILFTLLSVWVGARIFRTGILMQGQKPTFANLFRYGFKS